MKTYGRSFGAENEKNLVRPLSEISFKGGQCPSIISSFKQLQLLKVHNFDNYEALDNFDDYEALYNFKSKVTKYEKGRISLKMKLLWRPAERQGDL